QPTEQPLAEQPVIDQPVIDQPPVEQPVIDQRPVESAGAASALVGGTLAVDKRRENAEMRDAIEAVAAEVREPDAREAGTPGAAPIAAKPARRSWTDRL